MTLPADFQRVLPIVAVAVVVLGAAVLVTRGLGGGTSATNAQQVFDRAIKEEPKSARLAMRFQFLAENAKTHKNATIVDSLATGVGTDTAGDKTAKQRLHVEDRFVDQSPASYDEISTGDRGFIRVDGTWYRLSPAQYKRVFEPGESFTQGPDLHLQTWMRDPKLEGTTKAGGVDLNHIQGEANVDAMLTDLDFYKPDANESADAREFTQAIKAAPKEGTIDVLAGKQDGMLRKLLVTTRMSTTLNGTPMLITFTLDLRLSEHNKPVAIEAPAKALPPSRTAGIPREKLGSEAEDVLGPKPKPAPARKARAHKRGSQRRAGAQQYLSCVQAAANLAALQRCQPLVP